MIAYRIDASASHSGTAPTYRAAAQDCHALAADLVRGGERGLMTLHVGGDVAFLAPADTGDPRGDVPATIASIRRLREVEPGDLATPAPVEPATPAPGTSDAAEAPAAVFDTDPDTGEVGITCPRCGGDVHEQDSATRWHRADAARWRADGQLWVEWGACGDPDFCHDRYFCDACDADVTIPVGIDAEYTR